TVEDIVEELFGEIEDEYDTISHVEKQLAENSYSFSARLEVDYLNQKYNLDLPESEFYETLGGMIAYTTGEIPEKGTHIEIPPFIMKIEKVSATKLEQIILTKTEMS
ncbi:MAG: putative hemolysin, partial [Flavobacteriaceae bacterium]